MGLVPHVPAHELAREEEFLPHRALAKGLLSLALMLMLACLTCPRGRADVGIVLNESLGVSMDRISGTGHSAVYFSRICPESPVRLRLCRPDENGSVMSNYINMGEPQGFEWNIVPLNIYLYGVEDSRFRPLFGSHAIKNLLEERYRTKYLQGYCDGPPCSTSYKSEWREMVAATLIRGMYVFVIDTTVEQDEALIAQFNASPNENHFNGVTRNCADFTKRVINTYFPHAASTDYLNDFGMTTPKAVARTLVHYAERNPKLNLRVMHFAQVPGTIKRSSDVRAVTEQLYRSKKLLIPMLIFADYGVPVVAASYLLTGRFNPEREFEKRPGQAENRSYAARSPKAQEEEQAEIVGTSAEWKRYRQEVDSLLGERGQGNASEKPADLHRFFKQVSKLGKPRLDADGAVWMEVTDKGKVFQVGLSANNVLGQDSDTESAYALLLWRADGILKGPKHRRETLPEFEHSWGLLQQARLRNSEVAAKNLTPEKLARSGVSSDGGNDD